MDFKPFTRKEWVITVALAIFAVAAPLVPIINHQIQRNRAESDFQKQLDKIDHDSRSRMAAK